MALLVSGCGGTSAQPREARDGTAPVASPTFRPGARSSNDDDADAPERSGAPSPKQARAVIAIGRSLDDVADAYAPVSVRVSFLVAADTLRRYAIEGDRDAALVRARTGAVRVEITRTRALLARSARVLSQLSIRDFRVRRIRAQLLTAITDRTTALDRLLIVLEAQADPRSSDDPEHLSVEDAERAFRTSWDASVRAARDATAANQALREALGLEPAPEEAFR